MGFPGGTSGKEPSCHCRRCKRRGSIPGQRRRAWQSTPVFWPGESLGQRSLVGYSPQGRKESDMIEQLSTRIAHKLQKDELLQHEEAITKDNLEF